MINYIEDEIIEVYLDENGQEINTASPASILKALIEEEIDTIEDKFGINIINRKKELDRRLNKIKEEAYNLQLFEKEIEFKIDRRMEQLKRDFKKIEKEPLQVRYLEDKIEYKIVLRFDLYFEALQFVFKG